MGIALGDEWRQHTSKCTSWRYHHLIMDREKSGVCCKVERLIRQEIWYEAVRRNLRRVEALIDGSLNQVEAGIISLWSSTH